MYFIRFLTILILVLGDGFLTEDGLAPKSSYRWCQVRAVERQYSSLFTVLSNLVTLPNVVPIVIVSQITLIHTTEAKYVNEFRDGVTNDQDTHIYLFAALLAFFVKYTKLITGIVNASKIKFAACTYLFHFSNCTAAADADALIKFVDSRYEQTAALARDLWEFAEVGYQEVKSSTLIKETLTAEGFEIDSGIAGIPTAFVATFDTGTGGAVIGILAEYDALPGINQDDVPIRSPIEGKTAGQACGHNLFGAGSVGAAIAVKHWLEETGTPGIIRLYGTPAEEGGSGKVYLVRNGAFDDVDVILHWHAGDQNWAGLEQRWQIAQQNFASAASRPMRQEHLKKRVQLSTASKRLITWLT